MFTCKVNVSPENWINCGKTPFLMPPNSYWSGYELFKRKSLVNNISVCVN